MRQRSGWRIAAVALAALTGSCAVDRGRGFGTLEEATLTARLETGDGHSPDEPLETELGYFVRLSDVRLQVGGVGLLALRNEALETSDGFDPANPPPGYTLCHGGHCHAEDGSLVDYADIEAELGESGEAQTVSVVSMPCEHELDLYALRRIELDTVLPSRELPRTQLDRAEVWVRRLRVSGEVWDGPEFGGFGEERVGHATGMVCVDSQVPRGPRRCPNPPVRTSRVEGKAQARSRVRNA